MPADTKVQCQANQPLPSGIPPSAALILCALNSQSAITGPQVAFAVTAYAVAAGAMLVLFLVMRPTNRIVYEPKLKYADDRPTSPPMGRNPFAWIRPLWTTKEPDLLHTAGLDAVAYLRFIRMMRWCLTIIGLVFCAVLIPIDVVSNLHQDSSTDADNNSNNVLVMITMRDVHGGYLWAHVVMSYFATFVALGFLWYNWRHMLRLRWDWFRSPEYQNALYARTLMITHVNSSLRSDQALANVLEQLKMPYPTTEVFIGRDMGLLPDLIDRHKHYVQKLERALVWYIQSPTAVRSKRPTTRVGGWMGIGGGKVDAIDHYSEQIEQVESSINEWRQQMAGKKPVSYGFASMGAVHYAHAAARSLRHKRPHGLKIQLAPPPSAIIWRNLTLGSWQRFRSSLVGFLLLIVLLFINAVPLTGVNLITNMSLFASSGVSWNEGTGSDVNSETTHKPLLKWLYNFRTDHELLFAAVAGILPPLISAIASWLLPIFMRRLAKYRGISSKVTTDRVILGQYYGYLVISQLIIFTLIGVLINLLIIVGTSARDSIKASKILDRIQLPQLPRNIKQQYFMLGNYWLTWMPLKAMLVFLDLSQLIKLMFVWFQKGLFSKTPRDVRLLTEPPFFEYSNYYANALFIGAVIMVYAPLSPLLVVLGAVVFWTYSIANKYQLMYVNQTKHETGGTLWQSASNRFLINLLFMQSILILSVLLEDIHTGYRAVACLPPIGAVILFKIYLNRTFERQFAWYIPSAEEATQVQLHKGDQRHHRLERRFGHPYLTQKLWTPMVHASSQALLSQIYRGRIDETKASMVDGRQVETAAVDGGLKIALLDEDQLEYDPSKDDDTRSIMSSTTMATTRAPLAVRAPPGPSSLGLGAGYEQQSGPLPYQQYLGSGSRKGTADEYEMASLYAPEPTHMAGSVSKDTLLMPSLYASGSRPASLKAGTYDYEKAGASGSQLDLLPPRSQTPMDIPHLPRSASPTPRYASPGPRYPSPTPSGFNPTSYAATTTTTAPAGYDPSFSALAVPPEPDTPLLASDAFVEPNQATHPTEVAEAYAAPYQPEEHFAEDPSHYYDPYYQYQHHPPA